MDKTLSFITSKGNIIRYSLLFSSNSQTSPWVVYLHGFKGFKDWGFVHFVGKKIQEAGFNFLSFNFSHNGVGEDLLTFSQPEKFVRNTYSLELEEAKEVLDHLADGMFTEGAVVKKAGLLGHSRGGGIALLASSHKVVSAIATWASVSTFFRYDQETLKKWKEEGVLEVENSRTGQVFGLKYGLYEDLEKNREKLNILEAVRKLKCPLCLIHGEADLAVSSQDGRDILESAEWSPVEAHFIEDAGHTFGAKHPFDGSNPHLDEALNFTLSFFEHNLKTS